MERLGRSWNGLRRSCTVACDDVRELGLELVAFGERGGLRGGEREVVAGLVAEEPDFQADLRGADLAARESCICSEIYTTCDGNIAGKGSWEDARYAVNGASDAGDHGLTAGVCMGNSYCGSLVTRLCPLEVRISELKEAGELFVGRLSGADEGRHAGVHPCSELIR